ncbi:MAG: phenylalanine--tRNA ligase beta subunit-related protein [Candidatus Aminicenantes bacterium]|nr:phenylalanine--tRNA ligase beta subunit-related protein [Candidatus Aminicenantes bacterium]
MELFSVSPSCRKAGLHSRAILFRGVSIRPSPPGFPERVRRIAADLRVRFPTPRSVRESAPMVELHSIFRKVGVNPRKLQPSCERLVQLVLKRGAIRPINNLVDTYNLVSLRWNCSLGAHDLDRLAPPVQLRFLNGDETFVPLGSREPEAFGRGEFGYVDARNRLVCRLDARPSSAGSHPQPPTCCSSWAPRERSAPPAWNGFWPRPWTRSPGPAAAAAGSCPGDGNHRI